MMPSYCPVFIDLVLLLKIKQHSRDFTCDPLPVAISSCLSLLRSMAVIAICFPYSGGS